MFSSYIYLVCQNAALCGNGLREKKKEKKKKPPKTINTEMLFNRRQGCKFDHVQSIYRLQIKLHSNKQILH